MFKDKRQVRLIAMVIAAVFVMGVGGLMLSQTTTTSVSAAAASSNIGVVNHQALIQQHPDMAKFQQTMQAEVETARKDFDAKAASMNDQQKQEYSAQLQQRLSLKQQELLAPIFDKVDAAIKAVAEAKGLTVVLDKSNVVFGGVDITDEVTKKFK